METWINRLFSIIFWTNAHHHPAQYWQFWSWLTSKMIFCYFISYRSQCEISWTLSCLLQSWYLPHSTRFHQNKLIRIQPNLEPLSPASLHQSHCLSQTWEISQSGVKIPDISLHCCPQQWNDVILVLLLLSPSIQWSNDMPPWGSYH